jgi:hypothetical protein
MSPAKRLACVCGAVITLGPGAAAAQWLARPNEPPLTQEDVIRLHAAVVRLNEGRSIGNTERWRSPSSRDAGEVSIVRTFTRGNMQCRTLNYAVRFHSQPDQLARFTHDWCRLPGGAWKIVEPSARDPSNAA